MKLKKSSYGAIAFAILLFSNPNFNAFDFFPDFIGAFIIATVIGRASDIVPFFAEAQSGFYKLGILSVTRFIGAFVMYANLHTGMDIVPLFTLVFSAIELIILCPSVVNLYRGLVYLGERSCATGIVTSVRLFGRAFDVESARNFTLAFVFLRVILNFIPQVCHLTFSNEITTFYAKRLYAPLEISMLLLVAALGTVWAVFTLILLFKVRAVGGVADGIIEMAGEERLAEIKRNATAKSHVKALNLIFVAAIFNLDIALESTGGFNVLPRFIFALLILFLSWGFLPKVLLRVFAVASTVIYSVISLLGLFVSLAFSDEFTTADLANNTVAQKRYLIVEALGVIELSLFLVIMAILTVALVYCVKNHTGLSPFGDGYTRSAAARHKDLIKRVVGFTVALSVTGFMKCVNLFLIGSPVRFETQNGGIVYAARLPWFGTATFILCILVVFFAFYLSSTVKDEVRIKYDLPQREEK